MTLSKLLESALTRKLSMVEGWCVISALTVLVATCVIVGHQRCSSTNPYRREYSGTVVDKLTVLHESKEGSSYEMFLVIEERNGNRSQISVSEGVYTSARIGMWIKRNRTGVQLTPVVSDGELRVSPP